MIKIIIEFCMSNLASGTQRARVILEKDPNFDVIEYTCLKYCGLCYEGPFAIVDGEYISAKTPDELVEKIYKYIE